MSESLLWRRLEVEGLEMVRVCNDNEHIFSMCNGHMNSAALSLCMSQQDSECFNVELLLQTKSPLNFRHNCLLHCVD